MLGTQVELIHYLNSKYNTKERFASFWHQINEITTLCLRSVLEIGIGQGLLISYLKRSGYNITSMDIDERLDPDVAGSIRNIPFTSNSFDAVACFEVLEHLPYSDFCRNLSELHRVSKKYVIISIPDAGAAYPLSIYIPMVGDFKKIISLPLKPSVHKFDGEHYWEIGKANYKLGRIIGDIVEVGFVIEKTYRVFEMPYHRFFVLRK